MLQWFLRFFKFTEFNEGSAPVRENPIDFASQMKLTNFPKLIASLGMWPYLNNNNIATMMTMHLGVQRIIFHHHPISSIVFITR